MSDRWIELRTLRELSIMNFVGNFFSRCSFSVSINNSFWTIFVSFHFLVFRFLLYSGLFFKRWIAVRGVFEWDLKILNHDYWRVRGVARGNRWQTFPWWKSSSICSRVVHLLRLGFRREWWGLKIIRENP